jgi:hypothetical protein
VKKSTPEGNPTRQRRIAPSKIVLDLAGDPAREMQFVRVVSEIVRAYMEQAGLDGDAEDGATNGAQGRERS